jgi:D-amino peptidase
MRTRLRPTSLFLLLVLPALSAACSAPAQESADERATRILEDPAPVGAEGPAVLVYHDMEGLSGQDDPNTFRFQKAGEYARGRELLTADVNAVVDGLFAGGARTVHVVDGHGSGSPRPDLLLDRLDPRATLVSRTESFDAYSDLVEEGGYDAIAVVGMHAKTGSAGFASHTFTLGIDMHLNGMSITETELVGYSWGRAGVPLIFASGDDRLAADLETMPWIEFVVTKTATSASTAELPPVDEVRAELREGARRAMEGRDGARAMRLATPVRATLRAVPPADLRSLDGVPGIDFGGDRVDFEAADFAEAYEGLKALVTVARSGYQAVLLETIRSHPDGQRLMREYSDRLFDRWLDFESGRWTPPAPGAPPEGRTYHGFH